MPRLYSDRVVVERRVRVTTVRVRRIRENGIAAAARPRRRRQTRLNAPRHMVAVLHVDRPHIRIDDPQPQPQIDLRPILVPQFWTIVELREKSCRELQDIARGMRLSGYSDAKRSALIRMITENSHRRSRGARVWYERA